MIKINVGLWQPSILLPTPAPKCMWLSSGHVTLHNYYKNKGYKSVSVMVVGIGGRMNENFKRKER